MSKVEDLLESISSLTVLEAAELKKAMEEKFGITAASGVAVAAGGGGEAGGAEEKTDFNIELTSAGSSKIGVIKVVREITGLGLKEAKDIVESAPKVIKEGVAKEEAEQIKEKLEGAGANVTLK